jgi:hypothetical protein
MAVTGAFDDAGFARNGGFSINKLKFGFLKLKNQFKGCSRPLGRWMYGQKLLNI